MFKKTIIGIIIVVVVVLGIGLYWLIQKQSEQPEKYTGPVKKITLAAYAGETGAIVYVAEDQGYFEENGLEMTIKDYESGKAAADALIDGEADIATSAGFVFVSNSFTHDDIRILGTVAACRTCELIARKDHGIEQPSDLKGKRIGITQKSTGEFFLGTFLTFNDLLLEDVEIVDLKPSEIVEAISNGEIDAGFTWDPNVYNIKNNLGENVVSWPGQSGQDFFFILLTKEGWIKSHPSEAVRFVKALLEAEKWIKENKEESKEFIRKKFGYDSNYIDYTIQKHNFVVHLPQALIIAIEDQARWRIQNKLTDAIEVPDYLDYIYMNALEKVKPEAVGIIH